MLQQHAATCRATYHPTGAPHGRDLSARRVAATCRQVCTDLNRTLIGFLKILMDQVKSFSVGKTLKTFLTCALLLSAMFLLFPKIPRATAVVSRTSSPLDKNTSNSFFRARSLGRPVACSGDFKCAWRMVTIRTSYGDKPNFDNAMSESIKFGSLPLGPKFNLDLTFLGFPGLDVKIVLFIRKLVCSRAKKVY